MMTGSERADEVHGAAGEDQIVPADIGGIGRQVREFGEPADAAEYPLGEHHAADDRPVFVPGTAENTMVPLSVSPLLVAAAADIAGAAETASAVPATSSAHAIAR